MNKRQRYVLYVCATVVVLMLLFPPFHTVYPARSYSRGYAFLLSGPGYSYNFGENSATVDVSTLLVQWLGVILVGAILWFAFRDKKEEAQKPLLTDADTGEK